mgnify:CR=1 FL=1
MTVLKKEERESRSVLQAIRYRALKEKASGKHGSITSIELKVEEAVTEQVKHDSSMEINRTQQSEYTDRFNEVQGRYYSIGSEITRLEQTLQQDQER